MKEGITGGKSDALEDESELERGRRKRGRCVQGRNRIEAGAREEEVEVRKTGKGEEKQRMGEE